MGIAKAERGLAHVSGSFGTNVAWFHFLLWFYKFAAELEMSSVSDLKWEDLIPENHPKVSSEDLALW